MERRQSASGAEIPEMSALCRDFFDRREGWEFVHLITRDYRRRTRFRAELLYQVPPQVNFLCVRIGDFVNDLIDAIRERKTDAFRQRYDLADFLVIEDPESLYGMDATQEELYHFLNARFRAKKPVLVIDGKPIGSGYNKHLASLFRCAKTFDLDPQETEMSGERT